MSGSNPPGDDQVMYPPPSVRTRFLKTLLVAIISLLMVALCFSILYLLLPKHGRGEFSSAPIAPALPSLAGVSMISADDGWAVGGYTTLCIMPTASDAEPR